VSSCSTSKDGKRVRRVTIVDQLISVIWWCFGSVERSWLCRTAEGHIEHGIVRW
jgi:hypothetical protein